MINKHTLKNRCLLNILFILVPVFCLPAQFIPENTPIEKQALTRILFVFDASQSMGAQWESDQKINIARNFLIDIVDSLENTPNVQMALRVYGHQSPVPPQDCNDTKLEVPFSDNNSEQIRQTLYSLTPKGTTPIANSLARSANDFPPCDNCRNIIVLITDGIEACDGDPCFISRELQEKGIILKPFVIGIGLDPAFRETFDCVGHFYNAREEKNFKKTLSFLVNQVLNPTTVQVYLLDENDLPRETNLNITFSDRYSNQIIKNYIHHLNSQNQPDTLQLSHLINYRIHVHSIPPVIKDSVTLLAGKHNVINIKTPQGFLVLKTVNGIKLNGKPVIIRKPEDCTTIHYQPISSVEKYITGIYDLEIPTIPPVHTQVEILQNSTTKIEIPEPGRVTFNARKKGPSSLYKISDNQQTWVMNLNPGVYQQSYLIQPGNYRVIYRNINKLNTLFTTYKNFQVESGRSIIIDM